MTTQLYDWRVCFFKVNESGEKEEKRMAVRTPLEDADSVIAYLKEDERLNGYNGVSHASRTDVVSGTRAEVPV
jgi:hypothetical protein